MTVRAVFQGTIIRNEPAYRPRPVAMAGYHKFSSGDYDAFVALAALEAIADQARRAAPNEMIGYLVGRPFRDAGGPYAVVTEAILAESARCGPAAVETSLEDEQELLATLLADHPLAERLGWFHSHPFDMPTYSSTDRANQRFWSEPYQLGLLACLDSAGGVSIFAFRGPEAEAIHPPYTAPHSPDPSRAPTFRPGRDAEHREATPTAAPPTTQQGRRRFGLALLALAVAVVWPVVYLVGVDRIVQAVGEGRDGIAPPAAVAGDGTPPAGKSGSRAPAETPRPGASQKAAPPARPVGPPTRKTSASGRR